MLFCLSLAFFRYRLWEFNDVSFSILRNKANSTASRNVWRARADLGAFHQIVLDDLYNEAPIPGEKNLPTLLLGRHLVSVKKKGEVVRLADVSRFPKRPLCGMDSVLFIVRLKNSELPMNTIVDQGSIVDICFAEVIKSKIASKCATSLRILAIHQATDSLDASFWLLRAKSKQVADLTLLNGHDQRMLFIQTDGTNVVSLGKSKVEVGFTHKIRKWRKR